jgi:hypothetical protein
LLVESVEQKNEDQPKGYVGDPLVHGGKLEKARAQLIQAHGNGDEANQHRYFRFWGVF